MRTQPRFAAVGAGLAAALVAGSATAVEPINFEIRNNADLAAVCSTPPSDPRYTAAIHFCHGVGVGFARYHEALAEGKPFRPLYCLPASTTRNDVMAAYLRYSKAHPDYDQSAVGDVLIKFLIETYPCPTASHSK